MTPDICIYHANCMDGFTAVWVVKTRFPDVEMVPAGYGDMPPEVAGKRVLVVDFSYPLDVLVQMAKAAIEIVVLDHHKTAEQALARLEDSRIRAGDTLMPGRNLVAHFDMNKSGARLAWEYCYGDAAAPPLVAYTEDRDLWRWALPDTRIINAALGAYDQTLEEWSTLNTWLNDEQGGRPSLLLEGMAILRQREKDIEALIGTTKRQMVIGGHVVDVANAPFYLASDVANILGRDKLFAATYFDAPDGRIFSLRSPPDGMDVSIIAKTYGGGGHQHAAGFKMPRGWEGDN